MLSNVTTRAIYVKANNKYILHIKFWSFTWGFGSDVNFSGEVYIDVEATCSANSYPRYYIDCHTYFSNMIYQFVWYTKIRFTRYTLTLNGGRLLYPKKKKVKSLSQSLIRNMWTTNIRPKRIVKSLKIPTVIVFVDICTVIAIIFQYSTNYLCFSTRMISSRT